MSDFSEATDPVILHNSPSLIRSTLAVSLLNENFEDSGLVCGLQGRVLQRQNV